MNLSDGFVVGSGPDGLDVGCVVGREDGCLDGWAEGLVGRDVGCLDGLLLGCRVGCLDGTLVG